MTTHGEGADSPVWSHVGTLSSESSSGPDSSLGSTKKTMENDTAWSTTQQGPADCGDWTPLLNLDAVHQLDAQDDNPLSDRADY